MPAIASSSALVMLSLLAASAACYGTRSSGPSGSRTQGEAAAARSPTETPPDGRVIGRQEAEEAPWIARRGRAQAATRNDLQDDVRYACNSRCTPDSMAAIVDLCLLRAKVDHAVVEAIERGRMTREQLAMLAWMRSPDGQDAREARPEALEGVERAIVGFEFLDESDRLLQRERDGYYGTAEERGTWAGRLGLWSIEVCQRTLVEQGVEQ